MRYAFAFDASACTGCKACQVACKDKNALPAGVLWRRVYEVSGGTWTPEGAAWANSVFAYNLAIGCNHCADPVCAAACPADAYTVRSDGRVWLDDKKCAGCGYCAWACPYGAPQYSDALGRMTKCDLCSDLIDEGLPPACVAACPMRALDLVEDARQVMPVDAQSPRRVFPLPPASRTRPGLKVRPHAAAVNDLPKSVANLEEVRPAAQAKDRELPLVAFTLLTQAAAGAALLGAIGDALTRPVLAAIGALIASAALVSLCHLGTKTNAWRTAANVGRSSLSREILTFVVFAIAWVVALLAPGAGPVALALSGAALVYTMIEVYRLDAVPGWRTMDTSLAFTTSALVLGAAVVLAAGPVALRVPAWLAAVAAAALVAQQVAARRRFYARLDQKLM